MTDPITEVTRAELADIGWRIDLALDRRNRVAFTELAGRRTELLHQLTEVPASTEE